MSPVIVPVHSDPDILACHAVMRELRPQVAEEEFVARVRRQEAGGYRLVAAMENGRVEAVAGYRVHETLAWGRILYVDDLVTRAACRSRGLGAALLAWLTEEAQRQGCAELHLDSGVQRHDAHRFYLGRRMAITSHHFAMRVPPAGESTGCPKN
jgi:GNAT superfamily N-acetyltransferase